MRSWKIPLRCPSVKTSARLPVCTARCFDGPSSATSLSWEVFNSIPRAIMGHLGFQDAGVAQNLFMQKMTSHLLVHWYLVLLLLSSNLNLCIGIGLSGNSLPPQIWQIIVFPYYNSHVGASPCLDKQTRIRRLLVNSWNPYTDWWFQHLWKIENVPNHQPVYESHPPNSKHHHSMWSQWCCGNSMISRKGLRTSRIGGRDYYFNLFYI